MRTTTQAPEVNLVATKTTVAVAVRTRAGAVEGGAQQPARGALGCASAATRPGLADGESGEHPDRVQRDQPGGVGVDRDQQHAREHG